MSDWIPVVSQIKSAVQAVFGDDEGARQTQENFIRQCIVFSQITSLVQSMRGDAESARAIQIEFLKTLGGLVDGVPLLGHIKGGFHYALKDKEGGDAAMKASSHTTAAVAGGVAGFIIGGPPGAIAGGIAAGTVMDGIITAAELEVSGKFKPEGVFRPLSDPTNPGKWVDGVTGVAIDGVVGHIAGSMTARLTTLRMAEIRSPDVRPNVENIIHLVKTAVKVQKAASIVIEESVRNNCTDPKRDVKGNNGTDSSAEFKDIDFINQADLPNEETTENERDNEEPLGNERILNENL